jgi:hypothetical protein
MMPISKKTRWIMLTGLLALTLAAVVMVSGRDNDSIEVVEVTKPDTSNAKRAASSHEGVQAELQGDINLEKLNRSASARRVKEMFPSQSWYVAPPPPPPAPPPIPTAPALPFVFIGKLVEHNGKLTIFVTFQDRNFAVKEGDVIDSTYRVNAIKGSVMELTYLPLGTKQTLYIGDQN